MFVYQPVFSMLEYKEKLGTEYITSWKSKGVYNTKLIPIKNYSLPNIKYFKYKIEIQFNNTPLVVEQNNYASKIINV